MENTSCSCGDSCNFCKSCDTPKCECFCDLYTEYEVKSDTGDEDDDDDDYDDKDGY